EDVPRVVALIVAISQGAYAFAPAAFGVIRSFTLHAEGATSGAAPHLFAAAALAQGLAIAAFAAGRGPPPSVKTRNDSAPEGALRRRQRNPCVNRAGPWFRCRIGAAGRATEIVKSA